MATVPPGRDGKATLSVAFVLVARSDINLVENGAAFGGGVALGEQGVVAADGEGAGHEVGEGLSGAPGADRSTPTRRARQPRRGRSGGGQAPRRCPGTALLAEVVIRKGVDHMPINRLLGIFRRLGADLPEATAHRWWHQAGDNRLGVLDEDTPDGWAPDRTAHPDRDPE